MNRVILHVDMDAFFASVEQRDHPEYRGRPVIVGSDPNARGVVCAASYEARRYKVRSAMPSRTAARLCPEGIFVRPRMEVYREESRRIMHILTEVSPVLEKVSVDEAYLDVSAVVASEDDPDAAVRAAFPLAMAIKQRILAERGLTASVGVASNKFLAKLGSDFKKPDGLTVIPDLGKAEFLRPLPVATIHGVGPVTAELLSGMGIHTIGDLQDWRGNLEPVLGSFAKKLRERAMGEDDRPVDPSDERKSIGAETTFAQDTEDRPVLRGALRELAADVAQTLEVHGQEAHTVQVKVRYSDFRTLTRQIRLERPVRESRDLYRMACYLLARDRLVSEPLRLLGISVSNLVEGSASAQLWLNLEEVKEP
jgi:DNA polymerase-4